MKGKYSVFQLDTDAIEEMNKSVTPEDFNAASKDEKQSMVEIHASVSYWKDAWRRFRANHVSMVALVVFAMILIFAFVGPYLIPYSYEDQYRSSLKLGPGEYSESEQKVINLLDNVDAVYSTVFNAGSLTAIQKGDYYVKEGGVTYYFTLESNIADGAIVYEKNGEYVLSIRKASDDYTEATPIEYTTEPIEGATEIKLRTSVFPHVFGTDSYGRDLMARCMYGSRVSLIIGIVAALIVLVIGAIYGSISGLIGGAVDFVMMRIVDLIYSVPDVLIVLLLQVVLKSPLQALFDSSTNAFIKALSDLGVGIVSIFITFALLYWVGMARIVRGQVLTLKQTEYVTAAKALGASNGRIIRRHLLPNCVGQIVIATCLQIPSAIFLESFLSFLGLGVSAPMASLGSLASDELANITLFPYRLIIPSLLISLIVLTLNLIGDGLRDALDPRLKK